MSVTQGSAARIIRVHFFCDTGIIEQVTTPYPWWLKRKKKRRGVFFFYPVIFFFHTIMSLLPSHHILHSDIHLLTSCWVSSCYQESKAMIIIQLHKFNSLKPGIEFANLICWHKKMTLVHRLPLMHSFFLGFLRLRPSDGETACISDFSLLLLSTSRLFGSCFSSKALTWQV